MIPTLISAPITAFRPQYRRPLCVGNGETAKGVTTEGMKEYPCHPLRPVNSDARAAANPMAA